MKTTITKQQHLKRLRPFAKTRWRKYPAEPPDGAEFDRLVRESFERGYTVDRLELIWLVAQCEQVCGDKEYNQRGVTIHTILRRVCRGWYDHLFN